MPNGCDREFEGDSLRIDIVTVFPEMVAAALDHSIVKRARERGLVTINVVNLRDFTTDRHRTTDDIPYGGGGGMVMKIEPIARALAALVVHEEREEFSRPPEETLPPATAVTTENETVFCGVPSGGWDAAPASVGLGVNEAQGAETEDGAEKRPRIVLTDPRGPRFTQETARRWARERHLIILCGHYEGVDERVRQHLVTDEISIGDYILTGGELPALIIADALTRLQPGALGDEQAPDKDTFAEDLLEYPHYTRPRDFNGWLAPDILLCGHHAQIQRWRRWRQLRDTQQRRPDLFARLNLTAKDLALLAADEPAPPVDSKIDGKIDSKAAHKSDTTHPPVQPTGHDNEEDEVTDGSGTTNHS
jgi:tRNA (guanine37-N1)-methyltransferase